MLSDTSNAASGFPTVSTAITPPVDSVDVDINGIADWTVAAQPGEAIVYFAGQLAQARDPLASQLKDERRRALIEVAERLAQYASDSLVHLVQRRIDKDSMAYIAVRSSRPLRIS